MRRNMTSVNRRSKQHNIKQVTLQPIKIFTKKVNKKIEFLTEQQVF